VVEEHVDPALDQRVGELRLDLASIGAEDEVRYRLVG
jgi:hypothetical protein